MRQVIDRKRKISFRLLFAEEGTEIGARATFYDTTEYEWHKTNKW